MGDVQVVADVGNQIADRDDIRRHKVGDPGAWSEYRAPLAGDADGIPDDVLLQAWSWRRFAGGAGGGVIARRITQVDRAKIQRGGLEASLGRDRQLGKGCAAERADIRVIAAVASSFPGGLQFAGVKILTRHIPAELAKFALGCRYD